MLLVVSGLPGVGKTTFADALARRLRAVRLSVDVVEDGLLAAGVAHGWTSGVAAYEAVGRSAAANLALGRTVVVDAVNDSRPARDTWTRAAGAHRVRHLLLRLSDEPEHRRRLESRTRRFAHVPEPSWPDVRRRAADEEAWGDEHLVLDAGLPIVDNVEVVLADPVVMGGRARPPEPDASDPTVPAAGRPHRTPGVEASLRPATIEDQDGLLGLAARAWAPVEASIDALLGSPLARLATPSWSAHHAAVVRGALEDAGSTTTVAITGGRSGDGEVAGFVSWRVHPASTAMSAYGEIEAIAVDPDAQRRGIGRRLLDHAVDGLRAAGVPVIMLATGADPGHTAARELYESAGFTALPTAQYWLAGITRDDTDSGLVDATGRDEPQDGRARTPERSRARLSLNPMEEHDREVRHAMLAEAAFWRDTDAVPEPASVLRSPELAIYVEGWGRPGDAGLVARLDGVPVGAIWLRRFTAEHHGYGFVDAQTPELTLAVAPEVRGRGVGRSLLVSLLAQQALTGTRAVSLSVEDDNPARALYESVGFEMYARGPGARTLVRRLRVGSSSS